MRTHGRKPLSVLIALSLVGVVATAVAASPASADPPQTVVVSYDQLAPTGPWAEGADTGTFSFRQGPGTPPSGTGSLEMTIASGQHEWLETFAYGRCATVTVPVCNDIASQRALADIDALSYSTYRSTGTAMPTYNIETHTTGSGGYTSLAFVPNNGLVTNGTWQTWDAMDPGDGVWYSSQDLNDGNLFDCGPFSCSYSWAQIMSAYPSAKVAYGLGPNVGTGGTFTGSVDSFTLGLNGTTTIFDFERVECTAVCSVNPATGDDAATGTPNDPLQTIQAGIDKVQAGGTVLLSAGTFAENVVVDKGVTIQGAGPSTVVVPATSDPNCGGAGGGSLCPGASSVFLVQADGVEIEQLMVDGDNPSLSGLSVGGADVDARNGIITNHAAGLFNGLSVHDVTVRNVFLRGMYASSGGTFDLSDNVVDNVQGNSASIGIFNFGGAGTISGNEVSNANDAIAANHSRGTQLTGNTVTASGSGVHSDNAGDGGGTADVLSGNDVSACTAGGYGVWTFVAYIAPTVSNNTVSGCSVGLAAFASCDLGVNSCPGGVVPTVTFTGNTVTGITGGQGLYVSTSGLGFGDGPVKVQADHNVISGADDGVYVEETAGEVATVSVVRSSFAGNTVAVHNAGVTNVRATCDWWGQTQGPIAGQWVGSVTRVPNLITSDLNGSCAPKILVPLGVKSVFEGDTGTTEITVTIRLDRRNSSPISVQWLTVDGTATVANGDYAAASGTLTWAPGTFFQTITVSVNGDVTAEANELFSLKLYNNMNAGFGQGDTKSLQIVNDD